MKEDRRTPESEGRRQGDFDTKVEDLVRQLADVINGAGPEHRQTLREYALGLIRDETEIVDAQPGQPQTSSPSSASPLAMALVLALPGALLLLLFAPVGLLLLGIAAVMAFWGVAASLLRPLVGGAPRRVRSGTP
ncbi:MAG: hypothetical protein U0807_00255 [Candidatus Binatia bacterium]